VTNMSMEATGISTEEYRGRVERIQAAMAEKGYKALLLYGDATRISNVRYVVNFTPVIGYSDIAHAVVLLPAEGDPTLFVSQMSLQWAEEFGWFRARPFSEMLPELLRVREGMQPPGSWMWPTGMFGMSSIELTPAEPVLAPIKAKKSPAEIELLRRAGEVTIVGLEAVKAAVLEGGKTELEVARIASSAMFEVGDGPAFKPQIQVGPDHSNYNIMASSDRVIEPGNSILMDFGAMYRGYVTDIARGATFGPVRTEQVDILKVAAEALEETCQKVRPGMTAGEASAITEDALLRSGYGEYSDEARLRNRTRDRHRHRGRGALDCAGLRVRVG
jgi:Xaa-Pro aminopeptidase